jgi:hypothetical protein
MQVEGGMETTGARTMTRQEIEMKIIEVARMSAETNKTHCLLRLSGRLQYLFEQLDATATKEETK